MILREGDIYLLGIAAFSTSIAIAAYLQVWFQKRADANSQTKKA